MRAEYPVRNSTDDPESDESTKSDGKQQTSKRGVALAQATLGGRRGGMGEPSRNTVPDNPKVVKTGNVLFERPSRVAPQPVETDEPRPPEVTAEMTEHLPSPASQEDIPVEPAVDLATENTVPADAVSAETTTEVPENQEPHAPVIGGEVRWAQANEKMPQPSEGVLYEGEFLLHLPVPETPDSDSDAVDTPTEQAETADESRVAGPVPTAAELAEITGMSSSPALREHVVFPRANNSRPFLRQTAGQPPATTGRMPGNPNAQPVVHNTPGTPNMPPYNPNAANPGGNGNGNTPPPSGGGPGGPHWPGNPMNPNNGGGNWNPVPAAPHVNPNVVGNALPATPAQAAEASRFSPIVWFLAGNFWGRRRVKRKMKASLKVRDQEIKRLKNNQQDAHAERQRQEALNADEHARLASELANTQQRLGNVQEQHQELETQHAELAEQAGAERKNVQAQQQEKAKELEAAEKAERVRVAQRFSDTRQRFEKSGEPADQLKPGEPGEPDVPQRDAQEKSTTVLDGAGAFAYKLNSRGEVLDATETGVRPGHALQQEGSIERGITARGQAAGGMVLAATGTTSQGGQGSGSTGGSGLSHGAGAGSEGAQQSAGTSAGSPAPLHVGSASVANNLPAKQHRPTGPVWPYVLALVVILFCLVALLA